MYTLLGILSIFVAMAIFAYALICEDPNMIPKEEISILTFLIFALLGIILLSHGSSTDDRLTTYTPHTDFRITKGTNITMVEVGGLSRTYTDPITYNGIDKIKVVYIKKTFDCDAHVKDAGSIVLTKE